MLRTLIVHPDFSVYYFAVVISDEVVSLCSSGWLQFEVVFPQCPSFFVFLFNIGVFLSIVVNIGENVQRRSRVHANI